MSRNIDSIATNHNRDKGIKRMTTTEHFMRLEQLVSNQIGRVQNLMEILDYGYSKGLVGEERYKSTRLAMYDLLSIIGALREQVIKDIKTTEGNTGHGK